MVATNGKIPRNEAATYGEVLREETHCKNPREDIQLQILEEIQVGELGSVLLQDANEDSQLPIEFDPLISVGNNIHTDIDNVQNVDDIVKDLLMQIQNGELCHIMEIIEKHFHNEEVQVSDCVIAAYILLVYCSSSFPKDG
nr:hypothetical protein Iba_chr02bCG11930 [Ipomoea batatas]